MLRGIAKDNGRTVKLYEARQWPDYVTNRWSAELFERVAPTELPMLGSYFVRMDAEFAHRFFYIPRNGPCDWQLERGPLRRALVRRPPRMLPDTPRVQGRK